MNNLNIGELPAAIRIGQHWLAATRDGHVWLVGIESGVTILATPFSSRGADRFTAPEGPALEQVLAMTVELIANGELKPEGQATRYALSAVKQ